MNVLNNNSPKYVESIIDNTMVYISDTENSALNLDEVFESSCNDKWFDVLKETIIDENVYVNFYTSGSTGYPKLIEKTLKQFEAEATKIVNQFTENIKDSLFLYTVPHYHSYGFVFAVLVPFMLEAKCINNRINYLETVNNFADYEKITIVTTPAFLKRIDKSSLKIKSNWYLFSSTGMLEEKVNDLCKEIFGTDVTEIYGSTEAGAMAYRRRSENQLWTRLSVVKLKVDENGSIECCSGYTGENVWIHVGDVVNMKNEDEFELLGREDSIVKIEGKRISVQQIDRQILMDKHFKDSYTIYCKSDKREYIVSFIVMNNKNRNSEDMKKYVIDYLKGYFETVVLPKKIYFVDSIPRSEIGKIDRKALDAIMEGN
ncbi:AMP-binding protein [Brachyspira hyodysenteriae]|uniref:AMP-binding protein n=1 Tax=Brachyspira hyodysenteriae TaxID=159 RepID=UPI000A7A5961|nr:class I adenylate-forming enzyme family protein [Brachyspira hyodysenteriae]